MTESISARPPNRGASAAATAQRADLARARLLTPPLRCAPAQRWVPLWLLVLALAAPACGGGGEGVAIDARAASDAAVVSDAGAVCDGSIVSDAGVAFDAAVVSDAGAGCDDGVAIEVGTSNQDGTSFVEVPDGTEVTLEPGAQGGFHVWLNLRVRGISGRLFVEREARRAVDGALVFRGLRQAIDIDPAALDDWWESPAAAPAFMCPSPIGIQVYDEPLVFAIRLLDADDQVLASDELALVPRCPEDAQADFCRDICAG